MNCRSARTIQIAAKKVGDFGLSTSSIFLVSPHYNMTTRKHNEFLDIGSSDEEPASDRGYDSEENVAKSKGRAVKRRRTADTQDFFGLESDEDESADEEEEDHSETKGKRGKQSKAKQPASDEDNEDEDEDEDDQDGGALLDTTKPKNPVKPFSTKRLKEPKKNKTGVVYLSSLPPYLKPFALKNMLEARGFSPITKVFLSPLAPSNSGLKRRSNKRQMYNDGWVEFEKVCAPQDFSSYAPT